MIIQLNRIKINFFAQFRELKKGKRIEVSDEEHSQRENDQVDVTLLIEENESLRKGMHEILESIRSQDGIKNFATLKYYFLFLTIFITAQSDVHVESNCLERLLEALDARHVAGWYHPAMRLQAQLQNSQGIASELREQLRFARFFLSKLCISPVQLKFLFREQEKMWKEQIKPVLERTESLKGADDERPAPTQRRSMTKFRAVSFYAE